MRRGCVCPINPRSPRPAARQIFGSCVVLPEPVSPDTMTTGWSRIICAISPARCEIGSSGGYVTRGFAALRAATQVGSETTFVVCRFDTRRTHWKVVSDPTSVFAAQIAQVQRGDDD